jgi:hypothetical protein
MMKQMMNDSLRGLRVLVDFRDQIQTERIRQAGQTRAIRQGADDSDPWILELLETELAATKEQETRITKAVTKISKTIPDLNLITSVHGLGYALAAQLYSMIDIERAQYAGSLQKYCGYGVTIRFEKDALKELRTQCPNSHIYNSILNIVYDTGVNSLFENVLRGNSNSQQLLSRLTRGDRSEKDTEVGNILFEVVEWIVSLEGINVKNVLLRIYKERAFYTSAEKYFKGQMRPPYNFRLHNICWNIGQSLIKTNSPYGDYYRLIKQQYMLTRPDWTKSHIKNASERKMIKLFLSHTWLSLRFANGLPISLPYIMAYDPSHIHYIPATEMGWQDIGQDVAILALQPELKPITVEGLFAAQGTTPEALKQEFKNGNEDTD